MSMISSGEDKNNEFVKSLAMGFGAVYYFFLNEEAQRQTNLFYSSPQGSTAFQVLTFFLQFCKHPTRLGICLTKN